MKPSLYILLTVFLCANAFAQSELCGEIEQLNEEIPEEYFLGRKYPYPGSPSPYVQFGVPDSSHVKFTLEDLTGRQTGNIVDCIIPAGSFKLAHEVFFRNVEFSSGVYLIKMSAESTSIPKTDFNGSVRIIIVK